MAFATLDAPVTLSWRQVRMSCSLGRLLCSGETFSALLFCMNLVPATASAQVISHEVETGEGNGRVTGSSAGILPSVEELNDRDLDEYGEVAPPPPDSGHGDDKSVAPPSQNLSEPDLGDTRTSGAQLYGAFRVIGDGSVQQFYYIRQDHFMRLIPNGSRVKSLTMLGAFGPHPIGAWVRVRLGYNYYFFPICAGSVTDDRFQQKQALKSGETALRCLK